MAKSPESHYSIDKLHMIFALVALLLLGAVGGLIMKDYTRAWKTTQHEFRALEIEKTRMKQDAAAVALGKNAEYVALEEHIKKAKDAYVIICSEVNTQQEKVDALTIQHTLRGQQLKFSNAELDAARYRFENARAHHQSSDMAEKLYAQWREKSEALKQEVEAIEDERHQLQTSIDACGANLADLERQQNKLAQKKNLLDRKLQKIDPDQMNMTNRLVTMIRDSPILDLSSPNVKIKQVVLKDITDDMNINLVPKVDRCITCHLGIDNPDYVEAPQPFTTHPNLELFMTNDSAHPVEEFGCTVCHGGRGRATSFQDAVHTPGTAAQKKEWQEKYDWHADHYWEEPMLPTAHTQASCFKCHSGQETIKGADKLNLGLKIVEQSGCYTCHAIKKYESWPKPGPNLTKIASKLDKAWTYKWIADPHVFRPDTSMPAFFNQSNNQDETSRQREAQEILAITEFLFEQSQSFEQLKMPSKREAKRGKELVASLGCLGCHQEMPLNKDTSLTLVQLNRQHGPTLSGLGTKTTKTWLFHWLKNPQRYHPETNMPDLRLTDQEAADIADYLGQDKSTAYAGTTVPDVNMPVLDEIVLSFLKKNISGAAAKKKLISMNRHDKQIMAGEKLIRHYGCYACHTIKGFEGARPIGTELTHEGGKSTHKLDFGFEHIDHTRQAWFKQKLMDPRIFDQGKEKGAYDKLLMPNFNFSEQEADAVTTALLGFVNPKTVAKKLPPATPRQQMIEKGQTLVRQLNCQGCHIIEHEGGAIQPSVQAWLETYDNRSASEAKAMGPSFSPPNLIGQGQKTQVQWLFDFLHAPKPIRPWLKARMPSYSLTVQEANTLIKYFNALDDVEFPFTSKGHDTPSDAILEAGEKLFSNDYFGCAKCHIVGDKMPGGAPDSWAPNFNLAAKRLKPEWIIQWMMNPQALLPGTKMPNYFDAQNFDVSGPDDILNGDEHAQIRALRDYLMTLDQPPKDENKSRIFTTTPPEPLQLEKPVTNIPAIPLDGFSN